MPQFEIVSKALEVASSMEHSPALLHEVENLLGRVPGRFFTKAAESIETRLPASLSTLETIELQFSGGIPAVAADGFLPPGLHNAQWANVVERYGDDPNRNKFLPGMFHALHDLKEAGVAKAYLGGSFVTSKVKPNDFDIAFNEPLQAEISRANLRIFGSRDLMKQAYGGECLHDHLEFFRQARERIRDIGVLKLDLSSLAPRAEKSPAYLIYESWLKDTSKRVSLIDRLSKTKLPKHSDFYSFDD